MSTLLTDGEITFWVISQPNVDGFCFNMAHSVACTFEVDADGYADGYIRHSNEEGDE